MSKVSSRINGFIKNTKSFSDDLKKVLPVKNKLSEKTPEEQKALTVLRATVNTLTNQDLKSYLEETIRVYDAGANRAAIVFLWAAVMEHLYSRLSEKKLIKKFDTEFKRRFGRNKKYYRIIRKKQDLLYVKERDFLEISEVAGLYNRNIRAVLIKDLDTRNKCGHPTTYVPGDMETAVFIERLINNILLKI